MTPSVASLLPPFAALGPLGPGQPFLANRDRLRAFNPLADLGGPIVNEDMAHACHAGLWLVNNFLDESHEISQELHTPEGSFWHAIMHRREPDAWNSKYWWRKVGAHPVLQQLSLRAPEVGYAYMNPHDFVDFCERVRGCESPDEETAKRVQYLEWQLLFDHCFRAAIG